MSRGEGSAAQETRRSAAPLIVRVIAGAENTLLFAALAAMTLVPLAEIVLRSLFRTGISGATSVVQHLTLVVAMIGGAVAAREDRLLALSTAAALLPGTARAAAHIFAHACAAAASAFFCVAGVEFVLSEREAGKLLAYGLPVWVVQAAMPAGFAVIALRMILHGAATWRGRWITLATAGALTGVALRPPLEPAAMVPPALVALLVATVLGTPVFTTLGGAALILFWGAGLPIASLPIDHYRLVTNPTLPAIPLFTLAGYFLAEGGASRRLVRVFEALFGRMRGGPAIVTALVCAFFTSFTGASGVTILALGGLLLPILLSARYSERDALGLLTASGSLGLLFPPCLPLILYAVIARIGIEEVFLAGILPGALMVTLTAWWAVRRGPPLPPKESFRGSEAWAALWDAKWELLLPVVALGALFGGFATAVEAAALTALYAFAIETFVYRDLRLRKDALRVTTECGLLVGGVLLILGVALGFTNYLVDAEVPARAVEWVTGAIQSRWGFLLLLNVFLLVVGCLMDIFSALVVVVPLILPLGEAFGIEPVHLGIIFLANLQVGYLTPPVGMNLFLASYRFHKPLTTVYRAVLPLLLVQVIGVLLITYVAPFTTALPRWFGGD
ncbi:MAG: TRAP transporter large permease subunit [Bryobacterales bacterium]|nr:TRAP transporter large permease subunit [Bryobacteraceae bacterium]MDW8354224.1 TRAP transporter large permease subunit [Bryobacterales bacterium]